MWGDIMASFPERFKELRLQADLTQEALATRLGISKGAVGNYESGTRFPRYEDLEAIADFFNVEFDYLLGRTNIKPEFSIEEQWIIKCYRLATNDTKEGIKAILRQFDQESTVSLVG